MPTDLKTKTAQGFFWGALNNGAMQVLNAVFGIVLARKLDQADYGLIGMLTIFTLIANSLQDSGFVTALTNKRNATHHDYNAVFWFNISVSLFLYLLFFCCAPLIADFFHEPILTPLSRYFFISFFIASFSIVPRAILFRQMKQRELAIMAIISLLVSGTVGIVMAYNGMAFWGLATQNIVFTLTVSVLNYWFSGWRPTLHIDLRPVKELLAFSSRLIVTNIATAANGNIVAVLLGRYYSAPEVGDFTQANKWNTMGHSLITNMLYSIAQPVLTKTDEDRQRQKHVFRKLLRFTAFVAFPVMLTLALVSEEFIVILITEKWRSSAHILRVLCVAGAVMPVSYLFSNLLISRGRSSAYMWCTLSLLAAQLLALWVCVPYGIGRMVQAYALLNVVWLAVWFWLARKEIELKVSEAIADVSPYLLLTIAIVAVVWLATRKLDNLYVSFAVKVVAVGGLYCLALWLLRSTIFREGITFITKSKIE